MFFEKYILTCWRFANVDYFTTLNMKEQAFFLKFLSVQMKEKNYHQGSLVNVDRSKTDLIVFITF